MLQALCISRAKKLTQIQKPSEIARLLRNRSNLLWVDITNPEEDDIDVMVDVFHFHQLAIEDSIFPQNQPKLESYKNHLHVVLHELNYPSKKSLEVATHELNIFIGSNFVVTSHLNTLVSVSKLFQRFQKKVSTIQPAISRLSINSNSALNSWKIRFWPALTGMSWKKSSRSGKTF
jgi:magnesium transporter